MSKRQLLLSCLVGLILAGVSSPAHAIIVLDYTHDDAMGSDNFFMNTPTAKSALEAAATAINNILLTTLSAISTSQDNVSGTAGGTTATFDWRWEYTNPSDGSTESIDPVNIAANEFRVYAGIRDLAGDTLAQGGRGSVTLTPGGNSGASSSDGFAQLGTAVDNAEAASEAIYKRGGGPVMTEATGSIGSEAYAVEHGMSVGNIWFDSDTDNMGGTDSAATMAAFYHYDHTSAVAEDKYDFYTIAIHELLHAIGFGTSKSWDDNVSMTDNTDWIGTEAIAANGGSGDNLITGGHINETIMSTVFEGTASQTPVMTPSLGTQERREITKLDAAFLRDMGFSTTPEPSSLALLSLAGLAAIAARRRRSVKKQASDLKTAL